MISLSKTQAGVIFALLTAIGLGSITTQAKIFYADGGNAMTLMFIRFVISIVVFGLVVILKREAFAIVPGQLRKPRVFNLLVAPFFARVSLGGRHVPACVKNN